MIFNLTPTAYINPYPQPSAAHTHTHTFTNANSSAQPALPVAILGSSKIHPTPHSSRQTSRCVATPRALANRHLCPQAARIKPHHRAPETSAVYVFAPKSRLTSRNSPHTANISLYADTQQFPTPHQRLNSHPRTTRHIHTSYSHN